MPSLWYLAHMSAGDFDVIGATLPGAPAVAIGRNRHIAWGETNVAADVEDLYRERLDPTGKLAEFRGALEPLRIIKETIAVSGGDPIELDVRITRHGPLVSDAINANNAASTDDPKPAPLEPLAFRWTALDDADGTVVAFLLLNEARNWEEFTAALRHFVVPSQNFVYADVEGHIGYYLPGRIPIRASGDGSSPAEGWTGEMEWTGWVPFDELPHVYDPPGHFIVTANHRPVPPDYPYHIALEYPNPYRAQRITDRLREGTRLTRRRFPRHPGRHPLAAREGARPAAHSARSSRERRRAPRHRAAPRVGLRRRRRQRRRTDLPGLVPPPGRGACRRRARPGNPRRLPGALFVHDAVRHEHADRGRQRVVRRRDDAWAREL